MDIEACTLHIKDPRNEKNRVYSLDSLLFLVFSSVLSGYDSVDSIVEFGQLKLGWLQKYVHLPRVPSRETLRFLIACLKAEELIRGFEAFISLNNCRQNDIISIDGKSMRGTATNGAEALHVLSAWSKRSGITLCALASSGKKNEIKTVPKLLDNLQLKGATVSTDAMNCQRDIAAKIIAGGGDYVLPLKANQNALFEEVKAYEHKVNREQFEGCPHEVFEEVDKGHGRVEVRTYTHILLNDWVSKKSHWAGARSIVKVDRTRDTKGQKQQESSWYLSSLDINARHAAEAIRGHWEVENNLHWRLDVIFKEDAYRSNNCGLNMGIIKRFCMNLLTLNDTSKRRMKHKVMASAIDDDYRAKILLNG